MDIKKGGQRLYAMVGPNNEEHWGLTTYKTIVEYDHFTGEDAFTDNEGKINKDFPVAEFKNHFEKQPEGTMVIITTKYASEEHLRQVIQMGMKEGLSMAFENLDSVLNNKNIATN